MIRRQKSILKEEIKEPKQSEKFSDSYDVAKFVGSMHNRKLEKILGNDFILAKLDDKEKKFVEEIFKLAVKFENFIEDDETAYKVFDSLIKEARIVVILARNRQDNWLVKNILKISEELDNNEQLTELKHDRSIVGKLKKAFGKKDED